MILIDVKKHKVDNVLSCISARHLQCRAVIPFNFNP